MSQIELEMLVRRTIELVAEEEKFSKAYHGLEPDYCTVCYIMCLPLTNILLCMRQAARICQIMLPGLSAIVLTNNLRSSNNFTCFTNSCDSGSGLHNMDSSSTSVHSLPVICESENEMATKLLRKVAAESASSCIGADSNTVK